MIRIRLNIKMGKVTASRSLRDVIGGLEDGDYAIEIKKWSGEKTWAQIKTVKGVVIPKIAEYTGETQKAVERRLKEDYGITERFTDSKGHPCIEYRSFRYYSKSEMAAFIQGVLDHMEYDCGFIIDLELRKQLLLDEETGELTEI